MLFYFDKQQFQRGKFESGEIFFVFMLKSLYSLPNKN